MEKHLPQPRKEGSMSVEEALSKRKSRREYAGEVGPSELSQILWAAQGINRRTGKTAPSAGATYPFKVYAAVGEVEGVEAGLYEYVAAENMIRKIKDGDMRAEMHEASYAQRALIHAAFIVVLAAQYEKTTDRYKERGVRYVHMEAGHISENIYLQAESLGLGTVAVGAFDDARVKELMGIKTEPIYLMPVGRA